MPFEVCEDKELVLEGPILADKIRKERIAHFSKVPIKRVFVELRVVDSKVVLVMYLRKKPPKQKALVVRQGEELVLEGPILVEEIRRNRISHFRNISVKRVFVEPRVIDDKVVLVMYVK